MQCLRDGFITFNPDTLKEVRESINLHRPGDMDKAIDELEEWIKQQEHFTKKDYDRDYLERAIVTSKGSLERARTRMEKICTYRTEFPEYFQEFDLRNDFKHFDGLLLIGPIPKLTEDHYRVVIARHCGENCGKNQLSDVAKITYINAEYAKTYDYAKGFVIFFDYSDLSLMSLISVINISEVRRLTAILTKGFDTRLKALHIWSPSKLIAAVVTIYKFCVTKKIGNRIQVHSTMESIRESIPKELLPVEYGGEQEALATLHANWIDELSTEEFRNDLRMINNARVDESKRPKKDNP